MKRILWLLIFGSMSMETVAQSNLIKTTSAGPEAMEWRAFGKAQVEEFAGRTAFVVKNGGYFLQDIPLKPNDSGKYALLIGFGSSNRIFSDNDITDHPYLYGYMMPKTDRISAYLQGQRMLWESHVSGQWLCLYGVFEVPPGTASIRFFLNQASRQGTAHDGSAAAFDRVGLYIFDTEPEANGFAATYCGTAH